MQYIIFDLEFNSGKNKDTGKNLNEIIEIGAVKLSEDLREISGFSVEIKPTLTLKLNNYVKKLTNITESDLQNADDFKTALNKFKSWCFESDKNCVFSSWSNTDLFVLLENYSANLNKDKIGFIKQYFDMQKYITRFIKTENNNQVSLTNAAEMFGIDTESFSMHRAEDDSRVCAEMFRKNFDKSILKQYVHSTTGGDYYKRMTFKPFYIIDINDKSINKKAFVTHCPKCGKRLKPTNKITQKFGSFKVNQSCEKCGANYTLVVKFKKTYDSVDVKKRLKEILPEKKESPKTEQ